MHVLGATAAPLWGDYKFRDYTRTGLPLGTLMIATLSALLVYRYDLLLTHTRQPKRRG